MGAINLTQSHRASKDKKGAKSNSPEVIQIDVLVIFLR